MAGERASSSPPPPAPPGPEVLRAVLHILLRLACNGVSWVDPALGTPIGEHVTAEAIAVLQVGRRIFFPTPSKRRELLMRLLARTPGTAALDTAEDAVGGGVGGGDMDGGGGGGATGVFFELEPAACPDEEDEGPMMLQRLSEDGSGALLPQAILTEVRASHPKATTTTRACLSSTRKATCTCMGLASSTAGRPNSTSLLWILV